MSYLGSIRLAGKTVLITGATGHLGKAMAMAMAKEGAKVLVNSSSEERCAAMVDEMRRSSLDAECACFDIRDADAVSDYFSTSASNLPLDALVNNAHAGKGGTLNSATDDEYRAAYEFAVIATQRMIKSALPRLRLAVQRGRDASIINVSSMYGVVSPDLRNYDSEQGSNPPFYGAAKAALIQLTRYTACELGPEGIRCNALVPGPFPSPSVIQSQPKMVTRLRQHVPLNRVGTAEEIGGPAVFLASAEASFVNGALIAVDGGWTAW